MMLPVNSLSAAGSRARVSGRNPLKTRSRSSAGAVLATGPSVVRFDFNAPVRNGPNYITVTGPGDTRWERTENATVDGNSVSTAVAPLGPAGVYTAEYRIISADGHPVSGSITFTLAQAGNGTPVNVANAGQAANSSSGGGVPIWVWLLVAAVVLVAGVIVTLRLTRGAGADQGRRGNG